MTASIACFNRDLVMISHRGQKAIEIWGIDIDHSRANSGSKGLVELFLARPNHGELGRPYLPVNTQVTTPEMVAAELLKACVGVSLPGLHGANLAQ